MEKAEQGQEEGKEEEEEEALVLGKVVLVLVTNSQGSSSHVLVWMRVCVCVRVLPLCWTPSQHASGQGRGRFAGKPVVLYLVL